MFEIPADAPVIVVVLVGTIYIARAAIDLFKSIVHNDEQADAAAATERAQWMAMQQTMLTTVLEAQHAKYASFTQDMGAHFDTVVRQVQNNFSTALDRMVAEIGEQMRPVSEQRAKKLDAIQEDVRTVPGEVWRLGDPKLAGLPGTIRADLEPLLADLKLAFEDGFQRIEDGITARLDAMGETISPSVRTMINMELQQYQRQAERQFDRVASLVEALREDLVHAPDAQAGRSGVPDGTPQAKSEAGDGAGEQPSSVGDAVES